ncbi:MAG: hypothetical protein AAFY34_04695 [Pseudomonadota bacterium]
MMDRFDDRYSDVAPGDVVSIPFGGVLRHYGVVTHRGTVITNSRRRGGVVEISLEEFEDGRQIKRHRNRHGLHPLHIEARARRSMGTAYRLAEYNCIDLTQHSHRARPTPWQYGSATLKTLSDMVFGSRARR